MFKDTEHQCAISTLMMCLPWMPSNSCPSNLNALEWTQKSGSNSAAPEWGPAGNRTS